MLILGELWKRKLRGYYHSFKFMFYIYFILIAIFVRILI